MELTPFLCIYPYNDALHEVVIFAHCWADAHCYAQAHKMVVKEKLPLNYNYESKFLVQSI